MPVNCPWMKINIDLTVWQAVHLWHKSAVTRNEEKGSWLLKVKHADMEWLKTLKDCETQKVFFCNLHVTFLVKERRRKLDESDLRDLSLKHKMSLTS